MDRWQSCVYHEMWSLSPGVVFVVVWAREFPPQLITEMLPPLGWEATRYRDKVFNGDKLSTNFKECYKLVKQRTKLYDFGVIIVFIRWRPFIDRHNIAGAVLQKLLWLTHSFIRLGCSFKLILETPSRLNSMIYLSEIWYLLIGHFKSWAVSKSHDWLRIYGHVKWEIEYRWI